MNSSPIEPSFIFDNTIPFQEKASRVFRYQVTNNPVYRRFCAVFGVDESGAEPAERAPLLPVQAFRETTLISTNRPVEGVFRSSGTTGMERSEHHVIDLSIYRESVLRGFDHFYPSDTILWAYLPGYSENPHSSLIHMLIELTDRDATGMSRFIPEDGEFGDREMELVAASGRQLILFGAAFGLIDLIEERHIRLPADAVVIETGGMKTHRRAMSREELHVRLREGFGVGRDRVRSEYGMCELLSQAYTRGEQWFEPVPWMKVTIRDPSDPLRICEPGEEGKIGVVDLANIHSCSFLLTEDRGVSDQQGRFQVLGRWSPENLRGCNFLVDDD